MLTFSRPLLAATLLSAAIPAAALAELVTLIERRSNAPSSEAFPNPFRDGGFLLQTRVPSPTADSGSSEFETQRFDGQIYAGPLNGPNRGVLESFTGADFLAGISFGSITGRAEEDIPTTSSPLPLEAELVLSFSEPADFIFTNFFSARVGPGETPAAGLTLETELVRLDESGDPVPASRLGFVSTSGSARVSSGSPSERRLRPARAEASIGSETLDLLTLPGGNSERTNVERLLGVAEPALRPDAVDGLRLVSASANVPGGVPLDEDSDATAFDASGVLEAGTYRLSYRTDQVGAAAFEAGFAGLIQSELVILGAARDTPPGPSAPPAVVPIPGAGTAGLVGLALLGTRRRRRGGG